MGWRFFFAFALSLTAHAAVENATIEGITPPHELSTRLVPIPIYSTLPNEGNTYGVMPVFLFVEPKTEEVESILAPSLSWNRTIGTTGTFRWFGYPSRDRSIVVTASASSHVNASVLFLYNDDPKRADENTTDIVALAHRSIFFRFFGIGPASQAGDETSHTRARIDANLREGYNLTHTLNIGARIGFKRNSLEAVTVSGLPLTQDRFPNTPGMGGATVSYEALSVRYDSRENGDYSLNGQYHELSLGTYQGLAGSPDFNRAEWESRVLYQETPAFQTAGRAYVSYVTDHAAPFYEQSALGGQFLLRGFTEDRFIDQGAWELDFEERIRLLQTHFYGVRTDWHLDPFVALGQVYEKTADMFRKVRVATGIGFRAWVYPNILGRVDVATAGEGPMFYVEAGYPF